MNVRLEPGKYVLAVSGGVDSVSLLHILAQNHDCRFTVAHFDHGIRADSVEDRQFVQKLAAHYNLPFVYKRVELGAHTSEAVARTARYEFLNKVREVSGAIGIITAHHQDDVLETAILNLVRGTKGRGLHSLNSEGAVKRPLLSISRREIELYARANGLVWHEDSTNLDTTILRNYVRHNYVADMGKTRRSQLLKLIDRASEINTEIDKMILDYLHLQPAVNKLNRLDFTQLPHAVAREIMRAWLHSQAPEVELTRRLLERLVVAVKSGRSGSRTDIAQGYYILLSPDIIEVRKAK